MWPQPIFLGGGNNAAFLVASVCAPAQNGYTDLGIPADVLPGDFMVQVAGCNSQVTTEQFWLPNSVAFPEFTYSDGGVLSMRHVREGEPGTTIRIEHGVNAPGSNNTYYVCCLYFFRAVNPCVPVNFAERLQPDYVSHPTLPPNTYRGAASGTERFPLTKDSHNLWLLDSGQAAGTTAQAILNSLYDCNEYTDIHVEKETVSSTADYMIVGLQRNTRPDNLYIPLLKTFNDWSGPEWVGVNCSMSGYPDAAGTTVPSYMISNLQAISAAGGAVARHCMEQDGVQLTGGKWYTLGLVSDQGSSTTARTRVSDSKQFWAGVGVSFEDSLGNEVGFGFYWPGSPSNGRSTKFPNTPVGNVGASGVKLLTGTGAGGTYQQYQWVQLKVDTTGPYKFRLSQCWISSTYDEVIVEWGDTTFTTTTVYLSREIGSLQCVEGRTCPSPSGWMDSPYSSALRQHGSLPVLVAQNAGTSQLRGYSIEITGSQPVAEYKTRLAAISLEGAEGRPGLYYDGAQWVNDGRTTPYIYGTAYVRAQSVTGTTARGYSEFDINRRYVEFRIDTWLNTANNLEVGFFAAHYDPYDFSLRSSGNSSLLNRWTSLDDGRWVNHGSIIAGLNTGNWADGDVFGFGLDFESRDFRFYKNGVEVYHGNLPREAARSCYFKPYGYIGFSSTYAKWTLCSHADDITYMPEGFAAWDDATTAEIGTPVVRVYTSDDVWWKPTNLKHAVAIAIGAGGGGGPGGSASSGYSGSGGGGGGCRLQFLHADELSPSESITVGVGGAGAIGGTNAAAYADEVLATAGGSSSFGAHMVAGGGQPGVRPTSGNANGGAGGTGDWAGGRGGLGLGNTNTPRPDGERVYGLGAGGGGGGGREYSIYGVDGGFGARGYEGKPSTVLPGTGGANVFLSSFGNANDGTAGLTLPLPTSERRFLGGGTGGGGGGGIQESYTPAPDALKGGRGGDGGFPGGGGGGGGAISPQTDQQHSDGGNGADGVVVVYEYLAPTAAYRAGHIFYEETLNPNTPRTVNYPPEVQPGDLIVFTAEGVTDIDFSLLPAGHVVISKYVSGTNAIGYFNGAQTMCMWWAGNETSVTVSRTGIGNDVAAGAIIAYRNINPNVVIGHLDGTTGQSGRIEVVSPTNLVGSPVNPVPNYGSLLGSSDSSANDSIHLWHYYTGELDDLDAANFDTFGDHVNFLIPPFINNPANARRSGVLELPANQRTITNLLTNSLNPGTGGWTPHNINLASYTTTTYYNESWWRCDMASGLPAGEFGGFYQTVNLEAGKTYTLAGCMGGAPRSFMGIDDGSGLWGYVWPDSLGAGVAGGFGTIPSDAYGFGVVTPGNAIALKMQAIRFTPTVTGPHDIWIGGSYSDYAIEFPAGNRWTQLRMGYFSLTEDSFPWVTRPLSLYTSDGTNGTYTGGRGVPMRLTDAAVAAISNQRLEGLGMELLSTGRTPSAAKMQPLSFGYLSLRYSADKMEVTAPCSFTGSGNADTWASVSTPIAPYGFDAGPGKYQIEFQVLDIGTGFSVAVTNMHPPMDQTDSATRLLLDELDCYSYRTTSGGQIYNGPTQVGTGLGTFATNDVVGVTVDMITNVISFYKNGVLLGSCTGVNATRYLRCVVNVGNVSSDSGSGTLRLNAAGTFSYPVAGFSPWQWW